MAKLAIIGTCEALPGKRDELAAAMRAHGERCIAQEPGTLRFDVLVPREQADQVLLYEVYENDAAFDAHWNGPLTKKAGAEIRPLMKNMSGNRCDIEEE